MKAEFGFPSENGTWSGIIGQIQNGTVDICGDIILAKNRFKATDRLKAIYRDR